jgi:hypothetical protein
MYLHIHIIATDPSPCPINASYNGIIEKAHNFFWTERPDMNDTSETPTGQSEPDDHEKLINMEFPNIMKEFFKDH